MLFTQRKMSNNGIVLPKVYLTANSRLPKTDSALGFDEFARAAIEVGRTAYNPLPAGSAQEYAAFFSRKNYQYLYKKIRDLARNNPDPGELFEAMIWAYSTVQPRGDEMDERRNIFGADITQSYVREMNKHVIERVVTETEAANQLWDHYAKHMNGKPDFFEEDDGYIDTRTRFQGSRVDMSYYLP